MKKHILFVLIPLIFAGISLKVNAQLKWNLTEEGIYESEIHTFLGTSDEGIGLIFAIPNQVAFQETKYSILFRYFDEDMIIRTQYGLPDNTPSKLSILRFSNYTVIYGNNDKASNSNGNAMIIFLDDQRQEIQRKEWTLSGKNHSWISNSAVYTSSDSSYLIVDFVEYCAPDKPTMASIPVIHQLVVFNKNLEVVWEGGVNIASFSTKEPGLNIEGMDFTQDGQLLVYGEEIIDRKRHILAYTLAEAKSPATIVLDEVMPSLAIEPYTYFLNLQAHLNLSNELIIFCAGSVYSTTRNLFYIRQNLSNRTDKNVAYYLIDKKFAEAYPEFKIDDETFPLLHMFYFSNDGLVVGGEYIKETKTHNLLSNISLFKFRLDGRIAWVSTIQKEASFGLVTPAQTMNLFPSGEDLIIFYYDTPLNVQSDILIPSKRQLSNSKAYDDLCLVAARINQDGTVLFRKIINRCIETGVASNNSKIFNLGQDRFVIVGEKAGKNAFSMCTID